MSAIPAPPAYGAMGADPHGQAALLLVESLIHTLIDSRALSVRDAVSSVEVARDAQICLVEADRSTEAATQLLEAVLHSMAHDLPVDAHRG
jgi:hypothetical protein